MDKDAQDLIRSVNSKLDYIDELRKVMNGEKGNDGLISDVHTIKRKLVGDEDFGEEGLISIVQRHEDFYKKMQNIKGFSLGIIMIGGAVGGFITWFFHNVGKIKQLF